jgi:hypothetical protein
MIRPRLILDATMLGFVLIVLPAFAMLVLS